MFDTNASEITPEQYREFCVPQLLRIAKEVKAKIRAYTGKSACDIPLILFPKDVQPEVYALFDGPVGDERGYDVIGVGWKTDIKLIAEKYIKHKVLQGNLDPWVLYGAEAEAQAVAEESQTNAVIPTETAKLLQNVPRGRHVCNLGHGMCPDFKPEGLASFIKSVKAE